MTLLLILVSTRFFLYAGQTCLYMNVIVSPLITKKRWFHKLNMKSESLFMQMHHTIKTAL